MPARILVRYSQHRGIAEAVLALPLRTGGEAQLVCRVHVADAVRFLRAHGVDLVHMGSTRQEVHESARSAARAFALLGLGERCHRHVQLGSVGASTSSLPRVDVAQDEPEARVVAYWYDAKPLPADAQAVALHWASLNREARENRYVVLAMLRALGQPRLDAQTLAYVRKEMKHGNTSQKAVMTRRALRNMVIRGQSTKKAVQTAARDTLGFDGPSFQDIAKGATRIVNAAAPVVMAVNPAAGMALQTTTQAVDNALRQSPSVAHGLAAATQVVQSAQHGDADARKALEYSGQLARQSVTVPITLPGAQGTAARFLLTLARA